MSNRELLLSAAKAYGIHNGYYMWNEAGWESVGYADHSGALRGFNPLKSTKQMLEMAIKLQIDIRNYPSVSGASSFDGGTFNEPHNDDAMAAVRLAVTQCAASMWGGE